MRSFDCAVLASASIFALTAAPAFAQAAAPVDQTPQKDQENAQVPPTVTATTNAKGQPEKNKQEIVVTGSRIRRNNFNTPQNVDVITRDDSILAGTRSTAETLQQATITSGTSQIDGSFLGYLSDNGQAASTIGLRGLGSSRTLVLLNGRRLSPAGVGPQLVAADLNVLPDSIVQRIEVLREGASSIYGSDAIAGVINIITDTSIDGLTIDGYANAPQIGAGDSYRVSLAAGKTFSRGHITAALEYRRDSGLIVGDNPNWKCPRELAYQNGKEIGQGSPTDPNQLRCFPFERAAIGTARGYGFVENFTGLTTPAFYRGTFPGYTTGNPTIQSGVPVDVDNYDLRPLASPMQLQDTVFSPITTFTGYVNGSYDLDALGDAELYGEGLFTRRLSKQQRHDQLNFQTVPNRRTTAQLYGGSYSGYYTGYQSVPLEDFGFPVSPFFPVAWANAGINYWGPFIVPDRTIEDKQRVDFMRINGGLRGNLPFGDWRYDANVQESETHSTYDLQTPIAADLGNTLVAVLAPAGTPSQYITTAIPGQVGAGNGYTCASNLTNGAYNGGTCVPINFFDPNVAYNGVISNALYNYIYPTVNYTKTKFSESTFTLDLNGSLFPLQGGDLKAALGVEHRHDHIDDRPGAQRAVGDLLYYGTAGRTVGSDSVTEAYGELDAPIFRDRPFFHQLELDVSGRFTHYDSYGNGFTYHLSGDWSPVAAIRFRGNYGTNFRAPNLYEQFIADEVGFYPGGDDPCDQFGTKYSPGSTVYTNCLAALTPILGSAATGYKVTGGSFPVTTSGGRGVLKAEKARTFGFGTVLTVPRHIADFSLAVDYWHIKVKGEVGTLGNLILNFCYQSTDFPNNPYCAFIGPRKPVGDLHPGELSGLSNPYLNISQQIASGIDFDARFAANLLGGHLETQLQATRNLQQKLEYFPGEGLTEYNGTLGYPGQNGGPKWVGTLDTRFKTRNNITFRWGVKYIGPSSSQGLAPDLVVNNQPVTYDLRAEAYWEHGASVQWLWPDVGQVTLGVTNIFNAQPPIISDAQLGYPRIGNYFAGGAYDYRGRSFFVNVTRSFK